MSTGGNKTRLPATYAEALVLVSQLEKREVELLQRALAAETTVERLEGRLKDTEQDRDAWRGRWECAQASVGRWLKAHGEAVAPLHALREEVAKATTERDSALEQAMRVPELLADQARLQGELESYRKAHGKLVWAGIDATNAKRKAEEARDEAVAELARVRSALTGAVDEALGLKHDLEVAHAFHKAACAERDAAVKSLLLAKLAEDA